MLQCCSCAGHQQGHAHASMAHTQGSAPSRRIQPGTSSALDPGAPAPTCQPGDGVVQQLGLAAVGLEKGRGADLEMQPAQRCRQVGAAPQHLLLPVGGKRVCWLGTCTGPWCSPAQGCGLGVTACGHAELLTDAWQARAEMVGRCWSSVDPCEMICAEGAQQLCRP